MKHLFAIAVLVLAASGWAVADTASDERELTQLVRDLNAAIVKPDIAFLERVLAKDYVHYRPHGNVETRAQYLEDRKTGSVDFDSLVADEIKVRVYGNTALVTYRSTAKGKDQDGAIDEQRRWTRVFVRKTGAGSSCTLKGQPSTSPEWACHSRSYLQCLHRAEGRSNIVGANAA